MTLILYDGHYHEEHVPRKRSVNNSGITPASNADFEEYTFNIDISKFSEDDLELEKYTKSFNMLSLRQLQDTIPTMKASYDEYLRSKAKRIYVKTNAKELYRQSDSVNIAKLAPKILDNFDLIGKINLLNEAINKVKISSKNIKSDTKIMQWRRKKLNLYDIEFHNRIAFSLSCLILFFIGAPLGSIIRKGGFGLPMILAISIYVIYFFANTFGRNLAEESSLSAVVGSWISSILMIPFALFLTRTASKGMGLFNIDVFLQPITWFAKRFN